MVAREKLYRLKKRSRPLKQVKVKHERYMEKLSETYFSHLGFKSWEETEKRKPPMRAGSTTPLDFWFGRFSKNIGRIGSHRAPEAGVLAQGGPSAELLRKRYRRQVRRITGAAVLTVGLLAGATMSANALFHSPWQHQITEEDDDRIKIFSEHEDAAEGVIPAGRKGYYYPDYVPKGYVWRESWSYGDNISRTYKNGEKQLVFEYFSRNESTFFTDWDVEVGRYNWGEAEVICMGEEDDPENGVAICYMPDGIVTLIYTDLEQAELKKIVENLKFFEIK
ncbi:MAG: DUF4367 domain-containing protein [Lachnospiraceae bacterium]|nr:DUF4367 domain-containing protein [Lachnospiraceae bacterium]